ncbi:MAG: Queuine tRNA-ribosyltransferase, partial [uncultured Solirubrobacterales bacterium]
WRPHPSFRGNEPPSGSSTAMAPRARAFCGPPTARSAPPRSFRSPRTPRCARCTPARSPSSGTTWCSATPFTCSSSPATSTSPSSADCTISWPGVGRSSPTRAVSKSSRWATGRLPRRSSAATRAATAGRT